MGRECCRAGTGTLSIRIHQRAVRFTPGRRLVTPRPGAPRQGREQPGPAAAPRPRAARIWRLFVIRHAAPDTRIPAVRYRPGSRFGIARFTAPNGQYEQISRVWTGVLAYCLRPG